MPGFTETRRPQQTRPGVGGSNWVWELVDWGGAEPAASGNPEAEARGRRLGQARPEGKEGTRNLEDPGRRWKGGGGYYLQHPDCPS